MRNFEGVAPGTPEAKRTPEQIVVEDRQKYLQGETASGVSAGRLTSSVDLGLDAMSVSALLDLKAAVQGVAREIGGDSFGLQYWISRFGQRDVWQDAGQFADANDAVAQTYVVLSSFARKRTGRTLSAAEYVEDKNRIKEAMRAFQHEQLLEIRKNLVEQIGKPERKVVTKKRPAERKIIVPIVGADVPPLALAIAGYLGCVRRTSDGFVAESDQVTDDSLRKRGLRSSVNSDGRAVWFREGDRPAKDAVPVAERIDEQRVLLHEEKLAILVAADAIDSKGFLEVNRKADQLMGRVNPRSRSANETLRYYEASAMRYDLLAKHFGGTARRVESVPEKFEIPKGHASWISERENNPNLLVLEVGNRAYLVDVKAGSWEYFEDKKCADGNHDMAFLEISQRLRKASVSP